MSNNPQEDYQAIERLVEDADFLELNDYIPPFSLLGVINRGRDELAHSRIIAAMFDSRDHRHAPEALRVLLSHVSVGLKGAGYTDLATTFDALREGDLGDVSAAREKERIDVVLEFGGDNGAVIGIENKIHAEEQPDQISRYQDAIERVYPSRAGVIVFLTRDGDPPETVAENHSVPCIPLSYDIIREAADAAAAQTVLNQQEPTALNEFSRHIKEEIMGDVDIKNKARKVWNEHRRALKTLLRYRPTLEDIRVEYVARLKELLNEDDTEITYWPTTRGTPDEIKLKLKSWSQRGLPFVFMLHTTTHGGADGRPRLRLLITRENYESNKDTLRDLAQRINSDSETAIELDENFEPVRGWPHWCRVLKEDLDTDSTELGEVVIPGETEEAAISQIRDWIRELEPYVEELPSRE